MTKSQNHVRIFLLIFNVLVIEHINDMQYPFDCLCRIKSADFNKYTVKPVLSDHSKRRPKLAFKTNHRLMKVKSIAECSKRAFCNTFDFHYLRLLFWLFLSGRLGQVLLYISHENMPDVLFSSVTAVTLDETRLASGSIDKTIRIWDIKTGTQTQMMKGHSRGVWSLNFFTQNLLISGSYDGTIRVSGP